MTFKKHSKINGYFCSRMFQGTGPTQRLLIKFYKKIIKH